MSKQRPILCPRCEGKGTNVSETQTVVQPVVFASGYYCPDDGGDVQAVAVMIDQPGNPGIRVPALRLLCRECDWMGSPSEAFRND